MSVLNEQAAGVFIVAATPFSPDGALDYGSMERMLDFYLSKGISGMTVLGMMGEASKLSDAESKEFVRRVVRRVAGAVPIVVGVSNPGFVAMADLAKSAVDNGCAGVMVAPPPTLRTEEQIIQYFQHAASALGTIPFVLQDFPLSTGVHFTSKTLVKIAEILPTFVMLKHEDWPGLRKISQIRDESVQSGGRRISILVGNGGLFFPEELGRGADGAMTGFAYPEMMVDVLEAHRASNGDLARDLFDAYLPLMRYEQQPGIGLAVRKYVLSKRGVIACEFQREPKTLLGPREYAEIDTLIVRQDRRLEELGRRP